MISLTATEVERRLAILGLPNRFTPAEKTLHDTTTIVDPAPDLFAFPVPQDTTGLNILNLRGILGADPARPPSFFDHPWYLEEDFARQDCAPGWHALHMNVLPESIAAPYNYMSRLEERGLEAPSAIEVVLMLFLHYVGTGEQLLRKKHTWCRDKASLDRFVTVGAFGRNGVFISGHPAGYASRGLGVCARVRRPPSGG